jgi:predicted nucleotidyltransferase component of viral defense system
MISQEVLNQLVRKHQSTNVSNIVREYFQHLFLAELYKLSESDKLLFKGGTALRIVYGSPRFSEDLDFSLFHVDHYKIKEFVESLFIRVLSEIERIGVRVELGKKSNVTAEGYYGNAALQLYDESTEIIINISTRNGREMNGEVDSIVNDFVPVYNLIHLPQLELVEEKIFNALLKRKKPRDFYDLYFIMRKGMLSIDQKKRLSTLKTMIVTESEKIDFRQELGAFLPVDQQAIIRDFQRALSNELNRQLSGN